MPEGLDELHAGEVHLVDVVVHHLDVVQLSEILAWKENGLSEF